MRSPVLIPVIAAQSVVDIADISISAIPSEPVPEPATHRSEGPARPVMPLPLTAPVQLATEIVRLAADGQTRIAELRLDPPELGRLTVTLSFTEDGLSAVIAADRGETMDLLRRNADHLMRELSAAGFEGADLQFSDGSQGSAQSHSDRDETDTYAPVSAEVASAQRMPADGLDLRV